MEHIEDEYLRERRADLLDIERRVLRHLLGAAGKPWAGLEQPSIIVAHDLGPSEVAMLDRNRVLAFVIEVGGRTSHGAIVARGRGIPAADLPHVFDRFYRAVDVRTEPGSGLGLAIVAEIVRGHGGTTFARNRDGGGAEVGFTLP